jgi:hypothetical protein
MGMGHKIEVSSSGDSWVASGDNELVYGNATHVIGRIPPPDDATQGGFGQSISLSSDGLSLVTGSPTLMPVGKVYVLKNEGYPHFWKIDVTISARESMPAIFEEKWGQNVQISGDGETIAVPTSQSLYLYKKSTVSVFTYWDMTKIADIANSFISLSHDGSIFTVTFPSWTQSIPAMYTYDHTSGVYTNAVLPSSLLLLDVCGDGSRAAYHDSENIGVVDLTSFTTTPFEGVAKYSHISSFEWGGAVSISEDCDSVVVCGTQNDMLDVFKLRLRSSTYAWETSKSERYYTSPVDTLQYPTGCAVSGENVWFRHSNGLDSWTHVDVTVPPPPPTATSSVVAVYTDHEVRSAFTPLTISQTVQTDSKPDFACGRGENSLAILIKGSDYFNEV